MEDLRDTYGALNDEIEHSVVAHTKTVQGGIIMRPHEPYVGSGPGLKRVFFEDAESLLDTFSDWAGEA